MPSIREYVKELGLPVGNVKWYTIMEHGLAVS